MTNGWQTVELGKVMQVEIDAVAVDAQTEFHMAGVYSFARGLFKREPLLNTQTTYKFFHRLHKDMFVISVPKGWEGALARVTDNFDKMFLSPVYPTFRANPKELDIRYLEWYCRQSKVWDELRRKSRGIGARRESISAEQFLTLEIPLPPLTEQHRIVAHIESLAARVNEAKRLREEADKEAKSLLNSALSRVTQDLLGNHEPQTLEVLTLFIGDMNHDMPNGQEKGIPFISPKDFTTNSGIDFDGAKKITREDFERLSKKACPQKGDILMARYGTIGAARYVDTDRAFLASYSIAVIRPNPELVYGRFLYWMSISPYVQEQAIKGIRGSGMADLGLKTIRQFIIPHLNFDEQRRIVAYLDGLQAKVNALRELQSASGEELSALMPSILDKAFKDEL
jgi:restriction endonuclease S subunit